MKYFFSILLAALCLVACQSDKTNNSNGGSNATGQTAEDGSATEPLSDALVNTDWAFEHVSIRGQVMPVTPKAESHLKFEKGGVITGFAGCNAFEGRLLRADGTNIKMLIRPSANMSCEDRTLAGAESRIRKILENATTYEMRDNLLWIDSPEAGRLAYRAK